MVTPPISRPYQIKLLDKAREACLKQVMPVRLIVQGETGSGKSILGATLICNAYAKGKSALFIARGRTLVHQFAKVLRACHLPVGVMMAGTSRGIIDSPIQVASKDTLTARYIDKPTMGLRDFGLVIVDECHDTSTSLYLKLIARFPFVIGLTATPALANGDGMGSPWKGLVCCEPSSVLIRDGWLAPTKVFAPYVPDLKGVKKSGGDWVQNQLAEKMDRASLIGDIVTNWKKFALGRPTLVFAVNIQHAKHIRDSFLAEGIATKHIDQETPDEEREAIFRETTEGRNTVITNVAVMNRGVDLPCLACAVLARPTESFILFRQALGRIKRPFAGNDFLPAKEDAIVIDHAGAVFRHGMPDDDIEWKLGTGENVQKKRDKEREDGDLPEPTFCPECSALFSGTDTCPNCGFQCVKMNKAKKVKMGHGLLVPVTELTDASQREVQQRFWVKCLFVMGAKGRNFVAARCMFKDRFKEWPSSQTPMPEQANWGRQVKEVYPWTNRKKEIA